MSASGGVSSRSAFGAPLARHGAHQLVETLAAQRSLKALESERAANRRALYDAQDRIGERRDELIAAIERQSGASHAWNEIFVVRWRLA